MFYLSQFGINNVLVDMVENLLQFYVSLAILNVSLVRMLPTKQQCGISDHSKSDFCCIIIYTSLNHKISVTCKLIW